MIHLFYYNLGFLRENNDFFVKIIDAIIKFFHSYGLKYVLDQAYARTVSYTEPSPHQ